MVCSQQLITFLCVSKTCCWSFFFKNVWLVWHQPALLLLNIPETIITNHGSSTGKHYIVNGTKKWITNGVFCDYFVTGVRTDKGLSVLVIDRQEGVETSAIKTSYSAAAGTTFITFDKYGTLALLGNPLTYCKQRQSPRGEPPRPRKQGHLCHPRKFQPRALDDVLCRDSPEPYRYWRVFEMGQPALGFWKEADRAASHPAKVYPPTWINTSEESILTASSD